MTNIMMHIYEGRDAEQSVPWSVVHRTSDEMGYRGIIGYIDG